MDGSVQATFIGLPAELHTNIARYLAVHPEDLFSVLKTCRALHTTYSSKLIWDMALGIVCTRDALYRPSYPVTSMSVSQIQRAVMAPDLWNRRLRSGKPFVDAGMKTLSRSERSAQRRDYNRVYFVPGGRYLFEQARGNVSLWDLGLPALARDRGSKWEHPRIVDTIEVSHMTQHCDSKGWDIVVHPSPDGAGLRVWIVPGPLASTGTARFISEVHEIRTEDPVPRFQRLSTLDILLPSWAFNWGDLSMRDNQAILHSLDGVLIWDYVTSQYSVWSIREHSNRSTDILFLSKSSIYLVNGRKVLVWDIPTQLQDLPVEQSLDLRDWGSVPRPPANYIGSYEDKDANYRPLGRTFSHWYNSLGHLPALYDVLVDGTTNPSQVARYRVEIDRTNSTARLERVLTFPFHGLDPRVYCLHRVSNETLFTLYQECKPGFAFGVVFTPLVIEDGRVLKQDVDYGITGIDLKGRFCSFTFCSSSGRVAYSVVDGLGEWGNHSIDVFDYWDGVEV